MSEHISPFAGSAARPVGRSFSIVWKMLTILGLILIMLIPLNMVSGVIAERQYTRDQVVAEIAQTWAGQQMLTGPVLAVPYKHEVEVENEKGEKQLRTSQSLAYLLPRQYDAQARINPEVRYRGIYQSVVYTSEMDAQGSFDLEAIRELNIPKENILWDKAFLVAGIPNTQGINRRPELTVRGKSHELQAGVNGAAFLSSGLYAPVPLNPAQAQVPFKLDLSLKGSEAMSVTPVGKESTIRMESAWTSPSFIGGILPSDRQVDEKGFTASWDIPYFARNYGQAFTSMAGTRMQESAVGVQLLTPVDSYRQSERATKYGVLFLVLTFATYFLFEMISRTRLHPFQYLLVGCAISLFYLLLVALSEVIRFGWSYALASTAIIGVITLYSRAILGRIRRFAELIIGGLLVILYGYLYILLQLEDLSLLFGAIGLFIVLAVIMYVTRNIDWYNEQPT